MGEPWAPDPLTPAVLPAGPTRRSNSTKEGPGSSPGPNSGSGRSVIAERAYTGVVSANAAEHAPEPQPTPESPYASLVVDGFQHIGRRHALCGSGGLGVSPGVLPRH